MKTTLLFCVLLYCFTAAATTPSVLQLRRLYYQSPGNKDSAVKFMRTMESIPAETSPLMVCYKAMAYMVSANHVGNPFSKLSLFNKGKSMMEKAVEGDPGNAEIRFMRFCVQTNVPFFLGYSDNIDNDKKLILGGYRSLTDNDLKERIKNYLMRSKHCTKDEKSILL